MSNVTWEQVVLILGTLCCALPIIAGIGAFGIIALMAIRE